MSEPPSDDACQNHRPCIAYDNMRNTYTHADWCIENVTFAQYIRAKKAKPITTQFGPGHLPLFILELALFPN